MRTIFFLVSALVIVTGELSSQQSLASLKDGKGCAICVFALAEVTRLIHGKLSVDTLFSKACGLLGDSTISELCSFMMREYRNEILVELEKQGTADWVCTKLNICPKCHLTRETSYYTKERMAIPVHEDESHVRGTIAGAVLKAQFTGQMLAKSVNGELPAVDLDGDGFSPLHWSSRGADWRGKDCNDFDSNVHPGATRQNSTKDYNCNGIHGHNAKGSYKTQFCESYEDDRQLIFLGDSVTAGYMIPDEWLDLKNISHALKAFVNEMDWPMKVWGSGWSDEIAPQSIYHQLRNRNRCAHRQFQNAGKNGARYENMIEQIKTVRINKNDKPALAFVGYVGNDVCRDSLDKITKPADFEKQILDGLAYMETRLPPKSKVVLFGLVDGQLLWNQMSHLNHPFSSKANNITYAQFYQFLTCSGLNPCNTFLNNDINIRNAATQRAKELDDILERIAKSKKYTFEIGYIDFEELLEKAFAQIAKEKRPASDLIDAIDGFHPSIEYGSRVISSILWQILCERYPSFIGLKPNPFNEQIEKLFGNQGGH